MACQVVLGGTRSPLRVVRCRKGIEQKAAKGTKSGNGLGWFGLRAVIFRKVAQLPERGLRRVRILEDGGRIFLTTDVHLKSLMAEKKSPG